MLFIPTVMKSVVSGTIWAFLQLLVFSSFTCRHFIMSVTNGGGRVIRNTLKPLQLLHMSVFKSFCSLIHKAINYDPLSSNTVCLKPLSAKYLLGAAM